MANNFNFNKNKVVIGEDDVSFTTKCGNFANDETTFKTDGVPYATVASTTFTVTFDDADGSGTSGTLTVNPMQTIGYAITEKALKVSKKSPTYYFNEGIVTDMCLIPITSDITIHVVWTSVK